MEINKKLQNIIKLNHAENMTYHLLQLQKWGALLVLVKWLWCCDWHNETMSKLTLSLIFLQLPSPPLPVCFLLTLSSVLPLGISSTAYRWASTADAWWWPRRAEAALPREESGCGIAMQTETQAVGQFSWEEGWGAVHSECLAVGEWAWNGWVGGSVWIKCGLY